MRVQAQIDVSAPPQAVWTLISDPGAYLHFMSGMTRWEVVSEADRGVGARYRTLMRVGSAEMGGEIEVVESAEPSDLAWTSVTGLDQRGRWRLRRRDGDGAPRTSVELRLSYGIAGGGISGWVAEHVAAPTVRGHLRRTLQQVKRQVEHEQLRGAAAARRDARTGV